MEPGEKINIGRTGTSLNAKQKIPQYLAATTATLASFCAGIAIAWTSPVSNRLQGKTGSYEPMDHPLSDEEISWVGSLLTLGAIMGPLCGGIFIDRFGRKSTFMVMGGVPAIVGWIIILAGRNPAALYAARFLTGVSTGSASTLGPVYIAEVSSASERGGLCSLPQLMISLGVMMQYVIGPYVSYHVLAGINLVFPVLFVVTFFFMPESPYFLLAVGKREEAKMSLTWFRGGEVARRRMICGGETGTEGINNIDVDRELDAISIAVEESGIRNSSLLDTFKDLFGTNGNRRSFMIVIVLLFTQQFSGINSVLFNAESIFLGSSEDEPLLGASESAMVIGAVQIASSWAGTILADRLGRRPLLLLSTSLGSVSLLALGVYSYLDVHNHSLAVCVSWLPITSLMFFITAFCLGMGPLGWAVLGELFPSSSKSAAGILAGSFAWIMGFVVTRTFQPLEAASGAYTAYWLYSACCAAGFAFLVVFLPETKCKTLEEIQKELEGSDLFSGAPRII